MHQGIFNPLILLSRNQNQIRPSNLRCAKLNKSVKTDQNVLIESILTYANTIPRRQIFGFPLGCGSTFQFRYLKSQRHFHFYFACLTTTFFLFCLQKEIKIKDNLTLKLQTNCINFVSAKLNLCTSHRVRNVNTNLCFCTNQLAMAHKVVQNCEHEKFHWLLRLLFYLRCHIQLK